MRDDANNPPQLSVIGAVAEMYFSGDVYAGLERGEALSLQEMERAWITRGLPGADNMDKRNHPCWGCSQGKVAFGVIIPFLADAIEFLSVAGDKVECLISDEGIGFGENGKPLLSINTFALYCHTGTSVKLHAHLEVTLYTLDGAKTVHSWTAVVPNPSYLQRKKGNTVLDPEVRHLLGNDIYSPTARALLNKLMNHLCVGSAKLQKNATRTLEECKQALQLRFLE